MTDTHELNWTIPMNQSVFLMLNPQICLSADSLRFHVVPREIGWHFPTLFSWNLRHVSKHQFLQSNPCSPGCIQSSVKKKKKKEPLLTSCTYADTSDTLKHPHTCLETHSSWTWKVCSIPPKVWAYDKVYGSKLTWLALARQVTMR